MLTHFTEEEMKAQRDQTAGQRLASLTSSQVIRQTCLIQSVLCLPMVIRLQALIFPRRFRIFFPLKHLPNGGGAQKHNFWAVFYKKNH